MSLIRWALSHFNAHEVTHGMPQKILLLVLLILRQLISKTLYRGQRAPNPLE